MCIFHTIFDPIQKRNRYSFLHRFSHSLRCTPHTYFHRLTDLWCVITTMMCRHWKTKTLSNSKWAIQKAIVEQPWISTHHIYIVAIVSWRLQASTLASAMMISSLSDSQAGFLNVFDIAQLSGPQNGTQSHMSHRLFPGLRPGGSLRFSASLLSMHHYDFHPFSWGFSRANPDPLWLGAHPTALLNQRMDVVHSFGKRLMGSDDQIWEIH